MFSSTKRLLATVIISSMLITTSVQAAGPVAKFVADVVTEVATDLIKELMQMAKDDRGSIILDNATLKNIAKIEQSTLVFSNVGIDISGKNVKISGGLMDNYVDVFKVNAYFSNLGIKLASNGDITVSESDLINIVIARDSDLIGANAGISIKGK